MPCVIRPIEKADIEQVSALFNSVLNELHGNNMAARDSYSRQYTPERLNALLSDPVAALYAVEIDNAVAGFGFGRMSGGVGFLHWMGIKPNKRGGMAGQQLTNRFLKDFKNRGCHKVELYTYQNHRKLQRFYERLGFTETARLNNHYYHLDVVYMTRSI